MSIKQFTGDNEFLSNFYPVPGKVEFDGFKFPTVENAYQAAKCPKEFRSDKWEEHLTCTPNRSKKLGKQLPLRDNWDNIRVIVMTDLCNQKFQVKTLQEKLLNTGIEELIEGNWWNDTFWGVCNGKGDNMLGKILMNIRFGKIANIS